jgi:tRNA-specific 2-thiouridylase
MDMKKKLQEAYVPDKKGRKEKVLVALSGGVGSFVMAYLLKIQKYDLVAVSIQNTWDEAKNEVPNILSCHLTESKLQSIKDFCQKLSIPLQIERAGTDFKETVVEEWMGDRILGKVSRACWTCHDLRMKLLHQKMKETGAKHLATGHFAKLFHHEGHGSVYVHSSADLESDQSILLSRLPHEILNSLMLPLSELGKKEVLKLAENFGLRESEKALSFNECFPLTPGVLEILAKKIPPKLVRGGEVMSLDGSENFAEHAGILEHRLGESLTVRSGGITRDAKLGQYNYAEKKFIVVGDDYFKRKEILLKEVRFSEEISWIEPVKGILVQGERSIDCWIYPKTLSSVHVVFDEPVELQEGQVVGVQKKSGRNAKVYLTGEVTFLPLDPVYEEGEQRVPQADRSRHF